MMDEFALLRRIIKILDEHENLRNHVKLVGDSLSDYEAKGNVIKVQKDWQPVQSGYEVAELERLREKFLVLETGLQNHFTLEEELLPPLLGEFLIKALLIEHGRIKGGLKKLKSAVSSMVEGGLTREEFLTRNSELRQLMENLRSLLDSHARREDTILFMLKIVLEEKTGETGTQ